MKGNTYLFFKKENLIILVNNNLKSYVTEIIKFVNTNLKVIVDEIKLDTKIDTKTLHITADKTIINKDNTKPEIGLIVRVDENF